jgi:hypothetical protein
MATAQTTQKKLPAEAPSPSTKHLQAGNAAGFSTESLSLSTESDVAPALSTGWNYVHPQNCLVFNSGGYAYLYVYTKEGPYFYTTNSAFQAVIEPACQTGNWLAFYVYDSSNNWSEVYTYTYK